MAVCFNCNRECDYDDNFCYGCGSVVCGQCDITNVMGHGHEQEDHLQEWEEEEEEDEDDG